MHRTRRREDGAPTRQTQRHHTWAGKGDPCPGSYQWSRDTRPVTHEPYCIVMRIISAQCTRILYKVTQCPSRKRARKGSLSLHRGCLMLFVPIHERITRHDDTIIHIGRRTVLRRLYFTIILYGTIVYGKGILYNISPRLTSPHLALFRYYVTGAV